MWTIGILSAVKNVHQRILRANIGTDAKSLPPALSFSKELFASKADRQVKFTHTFKNNSL